MKTLSLLSILDIPTEHMRQAFAGAWGGGYGHSGWWHGPFTGWGVSWPAMIMTYGFWGLVIVIMILVIRRLVQSGKPGIADSNETDRPVDILKERFAKGEVTEEEFLRVRKVLQEDFSG